MTMIDTYTRADAIADGSLIEVSDVLMKEVGIKYPSCYTRGVETLLSDMPKHEEYEARLFDMLYMFVQAVKGRIHSKREKLEVGELMVYDFILNDSKFNGEPKMVKIKTQLGPGDDLAPQITFMLIDED